MGPNNIVMVEGARIEWPNVFGDAKMTTALLDRLTHHASGAPVGYALRSANGSALRRRATANASARRVKIEA